MQAAAESPATNQGQAKGRASTATTAAACIPNMAKKKKKKREPCRGCQSKTPRHHLHCPVDWAKRFRNRWERRNLDTYRRGDYTAAYLREGHYGWILFVGSSTLRESDGETRKVFTTLVGLDNFVLQIEGGEICDDFILASEV